jgi:hypothetical protein
MKNMIHFFLVIVLCLIFSLSVYPGDNAYGVNTHNFPNGFLSNSTIKNRLVNLGVKWIRAEVPWYAIETVQGMHWDDFDYSQPDEIVKFAQANDINILFILAYAPSWYGGPTFLHPDYISKWQIFVREMVERYDGDGHKDMPGLTKPVKHWGLWNEPNLRQFWNSGTWLMNASMFRNYVLGPGMDALRDADGSAKICGPDLSSASDPKGWLQGITNQFGTCFDVLTHHQYDGGDSPYYRALLLMSFYDKAWQLGYRTQELWVTETGYKHSQFSYSTIAQYLEQWMNYMNGQNWWHKTFWYCWRGDYDYGLLNGSNNPTPVYDAYKNYIQTH